MAEIVPIRWTPQTALRLVREISEDSRRVIVIRHGRHRSKQRAISHAQIIQCLQRGTISEGPYQMPDGDWRCNVSRHAAGERLTCVVEFDLPARLLVVTVFRG